MPECVANESMHSPMQISAHHCNVLNGVYLRPCIRGHVGTCSPDIDPKDETKLPMGCFTTGRGPSRTASKMDW